MPIADIGQASTRITGREVLLVVATGARSIDLPVAGLVHAVRIHLASIG